MNLLFWNCRGLGNPAAICELKHAIKVQNPSLVLLMETKIQGPKVEALRVVFGFPGCLVVDREGLGGGFALFGATNLHVCLNSISKGHIMCLLRI